MIIRRSAGLLGVTLRDEGADEIAGRSRGTPRIANRLLRRVRDFAEVRGDGVVSRAAARAALELYEVDESGLDRLDRAVLTALVERFGGGPVGLSTLAVAVGEEAETVEVVAEPFLVRAGLIARTPRGRVATPAAWMHLGLEPPAPAQQGGAGDGAARPSRCLTREKEAEGQPARKARRSGTQPAHLVAGRSRSLRGGRSLFVRGARAAKLRQLVFPSRLALLPVPPGVAPVLHPGRCAINRKEAPLWGPP